MTAASNEVVAVIQADRDFAAQLFGKTNWSAAQFLGGKRDKDEKVQAIARHRIAHSDPRPVAEGLREALDKLETRDVHNGYDERGNYIWEDYVSRADVRELLATHSPAPMAGWEDQRPQIASVEAGPEPSLRQMVRFYYAENHQPDPDADTAAYFAAHPSTQEGADRG